MQMFPRGFTLVEPQAILHPLSCDYMDFRGISLNVDTVQFAPDLRLICAWRGDVRDTRPTTLSRLARGPGRAREGK